MKILTLGRMGRTRTGGEGRSFSTKSIAIRLFLTCWIVYAAHFATNTVREIYPALSLGDHLSFDVSEYQGLHPDIFEMPDRGFFINNNPGASILGAIPYTLARPVIDFAVNRVTAIRAANPDGPREFDTSFPLRAEFYKKAYERGLDVKFALGAGVIQSFLMAPISALSVVVMFLVLKRLTSSVRMALLFALLYAFATPLFYRTAQLNHNLLQAHFAFFAFVLLWRPWDDPSEHKRPNYLLAGLLAGWTVVLDYSGVVAVLALGGYAFTRWYKHPERSWLDVAQFGGGIAFSAVVLMLYQWSSFGHPIFPAQRYMPATEFSDEGFSGFAIPSIDLLWRLGFDITFGLFTFAPIMLLALYIPGWISDRFRIVGTREVWFILLFTIGFFIFSSANRFAYVQFNTGVRHIVPVVPLMFLIVAGVLMRLPKYLAIALGVVGTYWSWSLAMYREVGDGHPLGVFDAVANITLGGLRLPWLTTLEQLGYVPDRILVVPLLLLLGIAILIVWSVPSPGAVSFLQKGKA